MKKSTLKFLFYIFCVVLISVSLKMIALYRIKNDITFKAFTNYYKVDNGTQNCYFIGSSRIRRSINPKILKDELPDVNFYNWGGSGFAFNNNLIMVEKLSQSQNNNIMFVEMSRVKFFRSIQYLYMYTFDDVCFELKMYFNNAPFSTIEDQINILNDIKSFILTIFSISKDVNLVIDPKSFKKSYGFIADTAVFHGSEYYYLRSVDLLEKSKSAGLKNSYKELIINTIKDVEGKNGRIVFLLPLQFTDSNEKELLLTIFNSIPDQNKLKYSRSFLNKIMNSEYLLDATHLNSKGAELYTHELLGEVKKQLLLKRSHR